MKCGRPHLMRESCPSSLMSGIWKRSQQATAPDLDSTQNLLNALQVWKRYARSDFPQGTVEAGRGRGCFRTTRLRDPQICGARRQTVGFQSNVHTGARLVLSKTSHAV